MLGMRSTAVKQGDHYVLNGRKIFITNGAIDDRTLGDVFLVYAKTDGKISTFLVERGFGTVFLRRPFPIAQQDRVDHQAGLAFTEQQIANRLSHQSPTRQADEDRNWIDGFTDERNRVGDGNRAVDLRNESWLRPTRCRGSLDGTR